ncbi:hypothetical protein DFJ74DRAFT_676972 [Hyaloraphidium curvatum]|nr:hypothetical protein DFJ74DRAFT_676972 [Hyaloraphidium curvatum]
MRRPIESLARAAVDCSVTSIAYGRCIGGKVDSSQDVSRDACAKEFKAFQECFKRSMRRGR